ncbi:ABC transporter permease [Candidatus Pseudoscillospira sp. SGI.172]|uniref:ABC transporter permease n=1 Tax=Candidatus Pseudoscillospira sp. SGI.172 TaxID=3420582 RepID=UPI0009B98CFC|nr:ABC transporter permease [Pseudoflavonifractor sp.]MDY3019447.1 ABC transporter permease [Oscillospiraceae bacterium]
MKRQNWFLTLMGDSKRQKFTIPILAILLSLLAGAVVYLILGKNPITAYLSYLQGSGLVPKGNYAAKKSMLTDLMSLLNAWTPMLFASLSVAVAMRSGLFNIGVSGQMMIAGLIATATVGYSSLPAPVAKPLVVLISALVGAAVAALIGFLKYKWNINEVVSAIMINYMVRYFVSFCIKRYMADPVSRQSRAISSAARLSLMDTEIGGLKMDIPLGIILAVIAVFLVRFLFDRMELGFEFRTIGANPLAARYAGINVGRNLIVTMALSGVLAGLAGATYFLGYYGSIQPDTLIATGFDAIAVSILGNSSPIGILLSSFLITVIDKGSTYMSSTVGVRQEIGSLITGLILLFAACGAFFSYLIARSRQKAADAEAKTAGKEERV